MEEKYFVNGSSFGRTWNQLLCWCDDMMREKVSERSYHWRKREWIGETRYAVTPYSIEKFFSEFAHNPNDGIYKDGYWKEKFNYGYEQQKDEKGNLTSVWLHVIKNIEHVWVPPSFTPKTTQVTDSYGRIIPSGFIRSAYMKYKRNPEDDVKEPYKWRSKYNYGNGNIYDHEKDFRKGPVPGIRNYSTRCGQRYAGDHAGITPWKRSWYAAKIERKECLEEFGVTFKRQKKLEYTQNYWIKKSWKRTRKEKQWM